MRLEGCKRNLLLAMRYGRLNGTLIMPIRQIIADFYFTHCPLLKFCFFVFLHFCTQKIYGCIPIYSIKGGSKNYVELIFVLLSCVLL